MKIRANKAIYNACQVYLASVSIGIGIVLSLPGDTFALSVTYDVLKRYPLSEDQWGLLFTALGVACSISAYFSRLVLIRKGDDDLGNSIITSVYQLLRLTWFLATPIWYFWFGCYLAVTPASLGSVFFFATGTLSLWVYSKVTQEARRHGK